MKSAPLPEDEDKRLELLRRYQVLDTPPEEAFDRITRIVAKLIDVPIALVSLVDADRQWFKSRFGIDAPETPRDIAFCAHAILDDEVFVVEDTIKDDRFADNPLVTDEPNIRFYAGAPLKTTDGHKLGTLCAIDRKPRQLPPDHQALLEELARVVVDEMELRKALQDSLAEIAYESEQRKTLNEYISYISHELKTPLTSIKGSLELIDNGVFGKLPEKVAELISLSSKNSESLLKLINDLLEAQQGESGEIEYRFRTVDINTLLREICQSITVYSAKKKIQIREDIQTLPVILTDPDRVRQAVLHLLSNAIKFSPDNAEVLLRAVQQGDSIRFDIKDNGPGIPAGMRHKLFKKFAKGEDSARIKGTGLGLNITKTIVEALGGSISFESTPETGTTFSIILPVKLMPIV